MGFVELLLVAVGLSMDAFAVSICKGLATKKIGVKQMCIAGIWFGGFQALMPLIGYLLGSAFADAITEFDHWLAFVLLAFIGGNMIHEAVVKNEDCEDVNDSFGVKTMFVMSIATSIDALAVGVTFAFLNVQIIPAISFIGIITFLFSFCGVRIGNLFGSRYEKKAELAGGIILILIGFKILLEHLGIL